MTSTGEAHTVDALLQRVASRDRGAYAELYDDVSDLLYGVILQIVRDHAISQEVLQEVFEMVWRRAARFDPDRGAATTWLLTIARRRAIDRVRSEQAHRDRHELVGSRSAAPPFDSVTETVEVRDEHRLVREALRVLSPLQQEAVEQAYFSGLTYREVAQRLGVPEGTVKSRIRLGLATLRRELGPSFARHEDSA